MHVRRIPRCCLLKLQDSRFRIIYECCLLHIFDSFSLFLCSICTIAPNISTVNTWVLIFWDFFCKPWFQRFSVLFPYYFIEYPSFCLYKWNLTKLKLNLFQTIQFGYSPTADYFSVHQFPAYCLLPCIHKSLINAFLLH